MGRWWILIVGVLAVGYFIADSIASAVTLGDYFERPITLVSEDGTRVPVWVPMKTEDVQPEGSARSMGGVGVSFGYRYTYLLPDGARATCRHTVRWMWCDGGWTAERA